MVMGTSMDRGRLGYTWGVIAAEDENHKHGLKTQPETSNKLRVKVSPKSVGVVRGVGGCLINLNERQSPRDLSNLRQGL